MLLVLLLLAVLREDVCKTRESSAALGLVLLLLVLLAVSFVAMD